MNEDAAEHLRNMRAAATLALQKYEDGQVLNAKAYVEQTQACSERAFDAIEGET